MSNKPLTKKQLEDKAVEVFEAHKQHSVLFATSDGTFFFTTRMGAAKNHARSFEPPLEIYEIERAGKGEEVKKQKAQQEKTAEASKVASENTSKTK